MNELSQGRIKEIKVTHRENSSNFSRKARIVIWSITDQNQKVWLLTVEGGLDSLNIEIKVTMLQEFFSDVIGREIEFEKDGDTFFAKRDSLPKEFLIPYGAIKKAMWPWIKENYQETLEKIKNEKAAKSLATKKTNQVKKEQILVKKLDSTFLLNFEKKKNPKHDYDQWEARIDKKLFILDRLETYSPSEKKVRVEKIRELVADKIILVKRVN